MLRSTARVWSRGPACTVYAASKFTARMHSMQDVGASRAAASQSRYTRTAVSSKMAARAVAFSPAAVSRNPSSNAP